MKIIDAHVNITQDGNWFNSEFNASFDRLTKEMSNNSIDKALLISLPFATTNDFIASVVNRDPEKFKGLGHIDFQKQDILDQVDQILSSGLSGIKIHPRIQGINLSDNRLAPLWEHLDNKKAIILVDGYYALVHHHILIKDLMPLSYEEHIRKYKNVTFILAHAGFHKVLDTMFLCQSYPNFYCNISFSLNYMNRTSFSSDYRLLIDTCDQKVLFGTDFPEANIKQVIKTFIKLTKGLDKEKINNVFYKNADKLFWRK